MHQKLTKRYKIPVKYGDAQNNPVLFYDQINNKCNTE